jgi:hypothetical protein
LPPIELRALMTALRDRIRFYFSMSFRSFSGPAIVLTFSLAVIVTRGAGTKDVQVLDLLRAMKPAANTEAIAIREGFVLTGNPNRQRRFATATRGSDNGASGTGFVRR